MNTIHYNALILYAIKHGKTLNKVNAFDNGWDLVLSLVKPFIAKRPTVGWGIGLMSLLKLMIMLNIPVMVKESSGVIFGYSISLVWSKRKKKDTLKKLKFCFQKCGNPLCESWFVRSICNVFICHCALLWVNFIDKPFYIYQVVDIVYVLYISMLSFYAKKNITKISVLIFTNVNVEICPYFYCFLHNFDIISDFITWISCNFRIFCYHFLWNITSYNCTKFQVEKMIIFEIMGLKVKFKKFQILLILNFFFFAILLTLAPACKIFTKSSWLIFFINLLDVILSSKNLKIFF